MFKKAKLNMKSLILITCLLQAALAAPQLITFKDGKVGVNFFGYHAEAGLGGGQDGSNGLLGGLHASAGTPWGQNAAAGLGGNVNGRAAGILYAGAQATPDVGASSILGGDTSRGGFSGADAYANGKVSSRTGTITSANTKAIYENPNPQYPAQPVTENANAIQKIRPPKKYHAFDIVEEQNYSLRNNDVLSTTKTKNIHDIQQDKPAVAAAAAAAAAAATAASVDLTKNTNKATLATALHSDEKDIIVAIPKTPVEKSLNIDANINIGKFHTRKHEFNAISTLSATPSDTPSTVSLSHSLNKDNSNGNAAADGVIDNNPTGIITITKERTKFRTHAHNHRRNWQKRFNANRQRHSSKSIVKVVELKQNVHADADAQQQQQIMPQTYLQQQQPVRRQLVAAPPAPPALPCDSANVECKSHNREVRSDVVQNALQIPVGILQSLQQTLGNLSH